MGLLVEKLSVIASNVRNIPLPVLFGLAVLLVVSQLLAYGIRNIYFHPLSNIPGPKLAALTEFYYIYNFIKGSSHLTITSLHSKYGPVVRVGPNKVSFNTPQSWKDIYGGSTSRGSFLKSDFYEFDAAPHIVTTRNPKQHEVWKKALAPAFSHKALAEQEPAVQEYIDQLVRQLDKHATGAEGADVVKWFTFAVFDVIGDLAFGAPFGGLESGKTHFWVKRVCDGANGGAFRGALVKLFGSTGVGGWLATWFTPRKERDARTSNYDFCREQVVKRMDSKTPRRDFFTPILNGPEGPTMGLETLVAQSFAFATAGSETSSSFLSVATYHLARNPLVLKRLATELHDTFPTYESINNLDAAAKCLMLRAVMNETFRIQPPVSGGLPRFSPGETVSGVYIPAGVEVFTHSYAATHSPANFVDPEKFAPERWLGGEVYAGDKKDSSQPFGVGNRACLGINLAKLESRLILAKIVWVFDIALAEPEFEWDSACTSSLLWSKPPLLVKLTRREGITVPPIDDLK